MNKFFVTKALADIGLPPESYPNCIEPGSSEPGFFGGVKSLKDIFENKALFTDTKNWCIVVDFIKAIILIALDFFFVLAVIMILYGSFTYITSNGDSSKADNGKKTILWAIAAVVLIAFSGVIVTLVDKYIRNAKT